MEKTARYIWSAYIIFWVYFIFFDTSYSQSDHIGVYLFFGWIPFAVLHWVWNSNTKKTIANNSQNISPAIGKRELTGEIDIDLVVKKIYEEHPEWKKESKKVDEK